jgi:hypothetical protein
MGHAAFVADHFWRDVHDGKSLFSWELPMKRSVLVDFGGGSVPSLALRGGAGRGGVPSLALRASVGMKRICLASLLGTLLLALTARAADDDGWVSLFNGKNLDGWKASENKDSWSVEDGKIVCDGPRSHLFYVGDEKPFKNFEFQAEVMTTPGSNSGIYFHTKYQETGWPKFGHEAQVNITHGDPKKSGSLYGTVDVSNPPAKDNEWHTQTVIVRGQQIVIKINDTTVVDYQEPEDKKPFSGDFERRLGSGTFALQAHDPKSKVYFKNLKVKRLP